VLLKKDHFEKIALKIYQPMRLRI